MITTEELNRLHALVREINVKLYELEEYLAELAQRKRNGAYKDKYEMMADEEEEGHDYE